MQVNIPSLPHLEPGLEALHQLILLSRLAQPALVQLLPKEQNDEKRERGKERASGQERKGRAILDPSCPPLLVGKPVYQFHNMALSFNSMLLLEELVSHPFWL